MIIWNFRPHCYCFPQGVPLEILGRGASSGSLNPELFQTKKMSYSSPFFRPGLLEIMSSLLKKRFLKTHLVFLFLSYSFGIETYNASIHSRSSLFKPYPSSRKKWVKSISVFRPKRHKNHSLCGGTYPCD